MYFICNKWASTGKGMIISFDIWSQQTALEIHKRTSSESRSINWWRRNCTITRNIFLSNNKVKEWNDAIFHILLQYLSGTETNVILVSQRLVQSTRTNMMKGEVLYLEWRKFDSCWKRRMQYSQINYSKSTQSTNIKYVED